LKIVVDIDKAVENYRNIGAVLKKTQTMFIFWVVSDFRGLDV